MLTGSWNVYSMTFDGATEEFHVRVPAEISREPPSDARLTPWSAESVSSFTDGIGTFELMSSLIMAAVLSNERGTVSAEEATSVADEYRLMFFFTALASPALPVCLAEMETGMEV